MGSASVSGIARALILEPKLIICDEPVSALDVSIQAQVVSLLQQLQREMGLSLIFIAHDGRGKTHFRSCVGYVSRPCGRTEGTYDEVYHNPLHPYTGALMSAVPIPDPDLEKNKNHPVTGRGITVADQPAFRLCFPYPLPDCRSGCAKNTSCAGREFQTRRFLPESRSALNTIRADSCQPFFTPKAIIYSRQMIWQSL